MNPAPSKQITPTSTCKHSLENCGGLVRNNLMSGEANDDVSSNEKAAHHKKILLFFFFGQNELKVISNNQHH